MKIAVFDPLTVLTDPAGSCMVLAVAGALDEHEVTVFSSELDASLHQRVGFVRVPVIRRPQVARYVTFRVMATLLYLRARLRGDRFDLSIATETCVSFATVFYVNFCHTAYLRGPGKALGGKLTVRSAIRRVDHLVRAASERRAYRRGFVVTVSQGILGELREVLGLRADRIRVLENPVDLSGLERPASFDPHPIRATEGVADDELLMVFVALGHYERKGLPELLKGMSEVSDERLRLVVLGGEQSLIASYQQRVVDAGLAGRVSFTGRLSDIKPWLWAADAFVLPSRYEAFSLALLQAAAAGLTLIATPINGTEELLHDGVQGILVPLVDGTPVVVGALRRFAELTPAERATMGSAAKAGVTRFDVPTFQARWREILADPVIRAG